MNKKMDSASVVSLVGYPFIFLNNDVVDAEFIDFLNAFLDQRITRNPDHKLELVVLPGLISEVIQMLLKTR